MLRDLDWILRLQAIWRLCIATVLSISENMAHQNTDEKPKIDLAYLLQKYGPQNKRDLPDVPPKPEYLPEGFCIKFRLSKAYRQLERQEREAAKPAVSCGFMTSKYCKVKKVV